MSLLQIFHAPVWNSGKPIAAAPLYIAEERIYGLKCRTIGIIGSGLALHSDFLLAGEPEEALRVILKHMMDIRSEWDLVCMDDLLVDSVTFHPLSIPPD